MVSAIQQLDALTSLHTALIDSRNGYREALEDAGPRGLDGLFREMIEARERHAAEIAQVLTSLGHRPDDDGSFMSAVHRTVIKVRSLFSELDESILPGLIDGEERILGTYDEAIAESRGRQHEAVLEQQRQWLRRKIEAMRAFKAVSR